jgi:hypothetical protein
VRARFQPCRSSAVTSLIARRQAPGLRSFVGPDLPSTPPHRLTRPAGRTFGSSPSRVHGTTRCGGAAARAGPATRACDRGRATRARRGSREVSARAHNGAGPLGALLPPMAAAAGIAALSPAAPRPGRHRRFRGRGTGLSSEDGADPVDSEGGLVWSAAARRRCGRRDMTRRPRRGGPSSRPVESGDVSCTPQGQRGGRSEGEEPPGVPAAPELIPAQPRRFTILRSKSPVVGAENS